MIKIVSTPNANPPQNRVPNIANPSQNRVPHLNRGFIAVKVGIREANRSGHLPVS